MKTNLWIELSVDVGYYVDKEDGLVIETVQLQGVELDLSQEQIDMLYYDLERQLKD